MRRQRLITVLVLSLWALAGSFMLVCSSSCATMGMACASLCAPPTGVVAARPPQQPLPSNVVQLPRAFSYPSIVVHVPTPPPKVSSVSA